MAWSIYSIVLFFPFLFFFFFFFFLVAEFSFVLYYYPLLLWEFFLMVSHWSLSDSNSPQVIRTLLSILPNPNNTVVWMVSNHPLISKSSSPYIKFLYLCLLWLFLIHNLVGSLFSLAITWSGRLAENRWTVCISKSQGCLCVSFSRTDAGLCIFHLFIWAIFAQFLVDHLMYFAGSYNWV